MMKGVPGLAGHGPSGKGRPRSTRLRPQLPTLLARSVGGPGVRRAKERGGRRAEWHQARRSGAVRAQVWLMSIRLVRCARLYPPIQLYSVVARQGPPAQLTNRGGFRELGFLPGLLGIAHRIAHEVAHGIAETHGTTDSEQVKDQGIRDQHPLRSRGRHTVRRFPILGEDRRVWAPRPDPRVRKEEYRVEAHRPTFGER